MPITAAEASDLNDAIERLLQASSDADREARLRAIFVEKLDFTSASGTVDLRGEKSPVDSATRIASAEGVNVVWAALPWDKVRITDSRAVSRAAERKIGDHLLAVSNEDASVWHFIYPAQTAGKPVLRRIVLERGVPRRTIVQQLAKVFYEARTADIRGALEAAYDVEPVTKEFFRTYKAVFDRVMDMI